jgi:hypothetical protein
MTKKWHKEEVQASDKLFWNFGLGGPRVVYMAMDLNINMNASSVVALTRSTPGDFHFSPMDAPAPTTRNLQPLSRCTSLMELLQGLSSCMVTVLADRQRFHVCAKLSSKHH